MKNTLALLILLSIILLPLAIAQENAPGLDEAPLVGSIQKISLNNTDFLKQEWRSLLEKGNYGKAILGVSDFFKNFNFFFKDVLGVEYSLSWSFIFALVFWFALFIFIAPILSAVFGKDLYGLIGGFAVASLVGLSGTIRGAVNMLNLIITKTWLAWLSFVIALIIVFVMEKLGKKFGKNIVAAREKAAKEQTRKDRTVIHVDAETSKEKLESYEEGGGI